MRIGASTANLYPMVTETALDTLLALGFDAVEIFFNTDSEITPAFVRALRQRVQAAGATVTSVHPFLSLAEPFCLFSQYERRFWETAERYRRLFDAAAELGARYLILHGDRAEAPPLSPEEFAARYATLYDIGAAAGVTLLQENVVHFRAQSPEFVRQMRTLLGERAQFTLDLKQCRRAGVPLSAMLDAMGDALRHLHLSDYAPDRDCLPPGTGLTDFAALFRTLSERGYTGDGVIELYRQNFDTPQDLWRAHHALTACLT